MLEWALIECKLLRMIAYSLTKNGEATEDLIQGFYLHCLKRKGKVLDPEQNPKGFIRAAFLRYCLNKLKKRAGEPVEFEPISNYGFYELDERRMAFKHLLEKRLKRKMPRRCTQSLEGILNGERTFEIAARLNVGIDSIDEGYKRLKKDLKNFYNKGVRNA